MILSRAVIKGKLRILGGGAAALDNKVSPSYLKLFIVFSGSDFKYVLLLLVFRKGGQSLAYGVKAAFGYGSVFVYYEFFYVFIFLLSYIF